MTNPPPLPQVITPAAMPFFGIKLCPEKSEVCRVRYRYRGMEEAVLQHDNYEEEVTIWQGNL